MLHKQREAGGMRGSIALSLTDVVSDDWADLWGQWALIKGCIILTEVTK